MYAFLRRHLPCLVADCVCALWYALLICAVLYCAFEPQTTLSYIMR
jgi:hypothetical protein